jgi:hypothetical protein
MSTELGSFGLYLPAAWNSRQAFYSSSVEAADASGSRGSNQPTLGTSRGRTSSSNVNARTGLERTQEELLAANEANDDLALGERLQRVGAELRGGSRSRHHDVERCRVRSRTIGGSARVLRMPYQRRDA